LSLKESKTVGSLLFAYYFPGCVTIQNLYESDGFKSHKLAVFGLKQPPIIFYGQKQQVLNIDGLNMP
jgi:hypothetical protein